MSCVAFERLAEFRPARYKLLDIEDQRNRMLKSACDLSRKWLNDRIVFQLAFELRRHRVLIQHFHQLRRMAAAALAAHDLKAAVAVIDKPVPRIGMSAANITEVVYGRRRLCGYRL